MRHPIFGPWPHTKHIRLKDYGGRHTRGYPQWRVGGRVTPDTPEDVSSGELQAWRLAHPEYTGSDKVARCLAWLEREFAPMPLP